MKLEYLMECTVILQRPPQDLTIGPFGSRLIFPVTGGSFEGPRLKGTILPGGGDWLLMGDDGIGRLDVRATLETDDGALIYLQYFGIGRSDPARSAATPGAPEEYGDRYYMITPRFETGDERYAWLNGFVCVAEGKRKPEGVDYRVYAVVND